MILKAIFKSDFVNTETHFPYAFFNLIFAVSCRASLTQLVDSSNQCDRARLLAMSQPQTGDWLKAIPSAATGCFLDDSTFSIAAGLRTGANVCAAHPCRCGMLIDSRGLHPLSCPKSAGRIPRHASINTTIKRALTKANIPCVLEPSGLSRDDGKRPDGLTLFPFAQGKCLLWDATVVDTFAPSNLMASATKCSSAADKAEHLKRTKYASLSSFIFKPLAFETSGVYGQDTLLTIRDIGRRVSHQTCDPRETLFLRQRLSIDIIRGNAASIRMAGEQ